MMKIPFFQRFSLSTEIFFRICLSLVLGILAWLWIRNVIGNVLPWTPSFSRPDVYLPDWFVYARQRSLILAWPIAIVMVISSNFLFIAFLDNNTYFSRMGYAAFSWPLLDFLPLSILRAYYWNCLPIGFLLALIAAGISLVKKTSYGNLIAVPFSIVWIYIALYYSDVLWTLTGDCGTCIQNLWD